MAWKPLRVLQVLGQWQVKNEGLRPYHRLAQQLARRFERFEAKQVRTAFVVETLLCCSLLQWDRITGL